MEKFMLNRRIGYILTIVSVIVGIVSAVGSRVMRAQGAQRVPFTLERLDTMYRYPSGEIGIMAANTLAMRSEALLLRDDRAKLPLEFLTR
jgi:hypothetical protein